MISILNSAPQTEKVVAKRSIRLLPLTIALCSTSFLIKATYVGQNFYNMAFAIHMAEASEHKPSDALNDASGNNKASASNASDKVDGASNKLAANTINAAATEETSTKKSTAKNVDLTDLGNLDLEDLSPEVVQVLVTKAKKAQNLEAREKKLILEQAKLDTEKQAVQRMMTEVKSLSQGLVNTVETKDKKKQEEDDRNMLQAVRIFESMPPKQAGPLLERMDPDTRVNIIKRMKDLKSSKILPLMSLDAQKETAEYLANPNKLAKASKSVTPAVQQLPMAIQKGAPAA